MCTACRPSQSCRRDIQELGSRIFQQQVRLKCLTLQSLVGNALTIDVPGTGGGDRCLNIVSGLTQWRTHQVSGIDGWHFQMQVNAVDQWTT